MPPENEATCTPPTECPHGQARRPLPLPRIQVLRTRGGLVLASWACGGFWNSWRKALGAHALCLPGKEVVRRGNLMGANVRKWQGCTLEGDGPPSRSGSTETTVAAAAAMAKAGLPLMGLRLLWRPPVEGGQEGQHGDTSVHRDRCHLAMQPTRTQEMSGVDLLPWRPRLCAALPGEV